MARVHQFPNPRRVKLVQDLGKESKEEGGGIWEKVARELKRSNKKRAKINLKKVNENTEKGDVVLIPGKVLGGGKLNHQVKVAAFKFSSKAEKRIKTAGGEVLSIRELMEENPTGSGVKILS